MEHSQLETRAKCTLLLSVSIFGTIGVFVRYIPLPSSVIALVRGVVGTLFLLLVVTVKKAPVDRASVRRNRFRLLLSGALIGANWILLFEAYRHTTVATATLCYYLAPVFITAASPFVLKERLTAAKGLCMLAALAGTALVSGVFNEQPAGGTAGVLCGIGAAVLYASVILINKRLSGVTAFDRTIVQLGTASLVLLPYVLLTERIGALRFTPAAVALLAILGVVHTGAAYAMYFSAIERLPAGTVAIFSYIDPVVAILLSTLLLRESMRGPAVLGAVLILGATLLSELLDLKTGRG